DSRERNQAMDAADEPESESRNDQHSGGRTEPVPHRWRAGLAQGNLVSILVRDPDVGGVADLGDLIEDSAGVGDAVHRVLESDGAALLGMTVPATPGAHPLDALVNSFGSGLGPR